MIRFFTLLLAASCLTAVGQVTYPYNPDGNADGDIAVGDLQDFIPKPILRREGVSDRREVDEGFWLFMWRRWEKVWQQNWQ